MSPDAAYVAERVLLRAVPRLTEYDPETLRRAFGAAVREYQEG